MARVVHRVKLRASGGARRPQSFAHGGATGGRAVLLTSSVYGGQTMCGTLASVWTCAHGKLANRIVARRSTFLAEAMTGKGRGDG